MIVIVLVAMMFCHIIDDYKMQGILASMKQKKWWEKNAPDKLYRKAFSWTCSIHIPVLIYCLATQTHKDAIIYAVVFLFNWFLHAVIDNAKANQFKINLIQDQLLHIVQIFLTWFVYFLSWI
jgi:hypothetical protein